MQLQKAEREKITRFAWHDAPGRFEKRIGSAVYEVNVHYDNAEKESLKEKILRMMKNDLIFSEKHGTIKVPQADWLPERGSL